MQLLQCIYSAVSKEASQKFRDRIREIRRNNKIVSIEKACGRNEIQ
ncbi:hypothetical protein [Acetivibrio clariflavus]|nr:hypothetical protein [Acetivibrio clariflavus]